MDVAPIYLQVIRNVIEGVRADFSTEQFEEASLTKLAKLWEQKVLESGSLRSFDSEIKTESRKRAVFDSHVATSSVEDTAKTVEGTKGAVRSDEILSSDTDDAEEGSDYDDDSKCLNLILAQFEKVARAKSKWKCVLKEGVMTLENRDILFGRGNGEFRW